MFIIWTTPSYLLKIKIYFKFILRKSKTKNKKPRQKNYNINITTYEKHLKVWETSKSMKIINTLPKVENLANFTIPTLISNHPILYRVTELWFQLREFKIWKRKYKLIEESSISIIYKLERILIMYK